MFFNLKVIKRIPWAQLFIEAVLVVLSVLLALAMLYDLRDLEQLLLEAFEELLLMIEA